MADIPTNAANLVTSEPNAVNYTATSAPTIPTPEVVPSGLFSKLFGLTGAFESANKHMWDVYNARRQAYEYERNIELENTAIQRRMADLKAAGLNPLLAVSGGGLSGGAQSTSATSKEAGSASTGGITTSSAAGLGAIFAILLKSLMA